MGREGGHNEQMKKGPVVKVTGPHMIRTEVETLDEAIDLLARRFVWRKPARPPRITIKSIARHAEFESRKSRRIVGVSALREKAAPKARELSRTSPKGEPQLYHVLCGRCGTPREQTIERVCPFYMKHKCLGELMRAESKT